MRALKKVVALFAATLFCTTSIAHAQTVAWSTTSPVNQSLSYYSTFVQHGEHSALDAEGNLLLVGSEGDPPGNRDNPVVRKIRPDGTWAWSTIRVVPDPEFAVPTGIAVDAQGDVFVSLMHQLQGYAAVAIKFDGATGAVLWEQVTTEHSVIAFGAAIAVDSAGDVFVGGSEYLPAPGVFPVDLVLVKYDGGSGQELWRGRHVGLHAFPDVFDVKIDADGDALLLGKGQRTSGYEYVVVKFDGGTGQHVWARALPTANAAANYYIADLDVDAAGDAIVTGSVTTAGVLDNVATMKFSGIDGTMLWERRYDGAGNDRDLGFAVVVDQMGNVSVAGSTRSAATGSDFLTLRYSGDGTLLWSRQFHSSGVNGEYVEAMTQDDHGNVYVTGPMLNAEGNVDFMTIGYAAETGRERARVQFDFGHALRDEPGEVKWSPDGSLWVAGEVPTPAGRTIGVMKIIVPMFADAFEAEVE
jgi:hypothetical protein